MPTYEAAPTTTTRNIDAIAQHDHKIRKIDVVDSSSKLNLADVDFVDELASDGARAREHRRAVSVRILVDQLDRRLQRLSSLFVLFRFVCC